MNNLTDIASENQRQWKSINALAAEVKTPAGRRVFSRQMLEWELFCEGLLDKFDAFIDSKSFKSPHPKRRDLPLRRVYESIQIFPESSIFFVPYYEAARRALRISDRRARAILAKAEVKQEGGV